MEYLQYYPLLLSWQRLLYCFKPYYKWNTFNTKGSEIIDCYYSKVLNLVINGIPSILITLLVAGYCYGVLNLVINGIPSILDNSNSIHRFKQ